jgi:O-antigen/teichoic acid export membrane protein
MEPDRSTQNSPDPNAAGTAAPSLGAAAKVGSAWALFQSVASKILSLACQVILARLLTPDQLGVASKALGVHGLLMFYTPPIMTDVLVQRKDRLDRDALPAFWITMLLGAATAVLIVASGPVLGRLFPEKYGDPALVGLLALLALKPLAWGIQVVSIARLRLGFRFRTLSNWNIAASLVAAITSVTLAALGFGPYAVVAPLILSIMVVTLGCEWLAPTRPFSAPTLAGSAPLLRDWTVLCLGQYAHTICLFADYIVLAFFAPDSELGFYYFAFTLSAQLNGIIIYNLTFVLQPIFATIRDDPARQVAAFLRVCRVLGAVTVPLCIMQGALAEPAVRLVFGKDWIPAAPMVTVLSLAQALAFTVGPTAALLKGQDRFGTYLRWQAWQAVFIVPALVLAAWLGSRWVGLENGAALLVATATLVTYALFSPAGVWLGIRVGGGSLRDALSAFAPSLVASLAIGVPAWFLVRGVDPTGLVGGGRVALVAVASVPIYALLLRAVDRETYHELSGSMHKILVRLRFRS